MALVWLQQEHLRCFRRMARSELSIPMHPNVPKQRCSDKRSFNQAMQVADDRFQEEARKANCCGPGVLRI